MTPAVVFLLGILAGFFISNMTAWWAVSWFRRGKDRGLGLCAYTLRLLAQRTGYESALVAIGAESVVVPFEQMARAIENRSLLTRASVRVTRSDRPPPIPLERRHAYRRRPPREDPPDGAA